MRLLTSIGLLVLASCGHDQAPEAKKPDAGPAPDTVDQNTPLNRRLLGIGREYRDYGIVTQKFSWVMKQCRMPAVVADYSVSDDLETHGNKLYLLYAKDWNAYVSGIEEKQPVGQVIVKEAWERIEVTQEREYPFPEPGVRLPVWPVKRDGKSFIPTARHGLFVMLKEEGGWRYGTVTADGRRVLQSGSISSCMECHRSAKPDALFGLPGHPKDQ